MRCETVKDLLEAYVEGELDGLKREEVEAHISGCESCKQELALTQSISRLVSSLQTPPVPEDIIPNTLRLLHEAPTGRWQWLRPFGALLSRKWELAAVSLLIAIFLVGISIDDYIHQRVNREPEIAAEEVAAAVEEVRLALGIVSAATQKAQFAALTEGARVLDITKGTSEDAMRTLSRAQLEVFEKLRRNVDILSRLKPKEVRKS